MEKQDLEGEFTTELLMMEDVADLFSYSSSNPI
jgi:hypothetical protein